MKVREEIEAIQNEFATIEDELQRLREATGKAIRRHDYLRGKLEILVQLEANGNVEHGGEQGTSSLGGDGLRHHKRPDSAPNQFMGDGSTIRNQRREPKST